MHKLPVRIYYEDTDAGGVVYHARYLHFFERARTEYLRKLNISQQTLIQEQDVAFVVKKMNVDYLQPAVLDDDLEVTTTITEIKKASILFEQKLMRETEVLCVAEVVIACVQLSQMKPIAIPENLKAYLTKSED